MSFRYRNQLSIYRSIVNLQINCQSTDQFNLYSISRKKANQRSHEQVFAFSQWESEKLLISKFKISNKDCVKFQNSQCEYQNQANRIIGIQHKSFLTGTLIFCSGNRTYQKLFEINKLCEISLTFLCHFYSGQRLNQYKEDDFYILVLLIDSFSLFLCIHAVWKLSRNKNLNRKSSLLYWYTTTTVNTYKKIKLRISWKIKKEFHDHLNLK